MATPLRASPRWAIWFLVVTVLGSLSIPTASAALYEEEPRLQQTIAKPHQARDQSPLQPYLFAPDQREAVPEKAFSKQTLLHAHSTPDHVVSPLDQLHDALEVMQSR
ncbi:hypothetical protein LTR16_010641, partial [Cryomyces antarcticus]